MGQRILSLILVLINILFMVNGQLNCYELLEINVMEVGEGIKTAYRRKMKEYFQVDIFNKHYRREITRCFHVLYDSEKRRVYDDNDYDITAIERIDNINSNIQRKKRKPKQDL
eukprot:179258_1